MSPASTQHLQVFSQSLNRVTGRSLTQLAPIDTTPFRFNPSSPSPVMRSASVVHAQTPPIHVNPSSQSTSTPPPKTLLSSSTFQGLFNKSETSVNLPTPSAPECSASFSSGYLTSTREPEVPDFDRAESHARSTTRPSVISTTGSPQPTSASDVTSELAAMLIPGFPTTLASIEAVTILNSVVMKRVTTASATPEKKLPPFRPGTSSVLSAFRSEVKPVWVSHQLVLTSFKMDESSPHTSPDLAEFGGDLRAKPAPSRSQTFAHLHLFAISPPQSRTPPRPSTSGSMSFFVAGRRPGTAQSLMNEAAAKIEVDRRALGPETFAGVWDEDSGDTKRKFVLKIVFEQGNLDEKSWLCSMPNAWVVPIK